MTKSTAPVAKTSALPAPAKRPFSIDICESSPKAFQLASALVRQGYVFLKDRPVEVYGMSGTAAFTVVLGEPDETGYADAEAAIRQGLEMEQAEFERRVEREVEARVEQIKRDEQEARKAALVAEHKKQIAQIEAAAAAEIAKLSIKL